MVQHAYSAVFWAMTELLARSIGIFTETSSANPITTNVNEISTSIDRQGIFLVLDEGPGREIDLH